MNLSRIIGWLTFSIGIIIIGSTIYLTYNIFTGEAAVPQIFEPKSEIQGTAQEEATGLEAELGKMLSEQLSNLIPSTSIIKFTNLAAWTVGAWILIFGGSKISELGIKLVSIPSEKEPS